LIESVDRVSCIRCASGNPDNEPGAAREGSADLIVPLLRPFDIFPANYFPAQNRGS